MKKFLLLLLLFAVLFLTGAYLLGHYYAPDLTITSPYSGESIEIDGVKIRYLQRGSGPDVVLIHGSMGNIEDWERLIPALSKSYRVTAFDRIGHGFSSGYDRFAGITVNAVMARKLIDKLNLHDVVVVGHGYGGSIALRMAVEHSENIHGFVLLAPVAYPDEDADLPWLEWIVSNPYVGLGLIRMGNLFFTKSLVRERLIQASSADNKSLPENFVENRVSLWNRSATLYSHAQQTVRLNSELQSMSGRYASIQRPVRLLVGENEPSIDIVAGVRRLTASLPKVKSLDLPNCGHYIQYANPQAVIHAIDSLVIPYYQRIGGT